LDRGTKEAIALEGITEDHTFFKHLVQHRTIDNGNAINLLPFDKIQALLKRNVLAAHPNKTYTFHSRHVQTFFERVFAAKE